MGGEYTRKMFSFMYFVTRSNQHTKKEKIMILENIIDGLYIGNIYSLTN